MSFGVVVPLLLATLILVYGLIRRTDVFTAFIAGAEDGLKTGLRILPSLAALVTGISMLSASGALDMLVWLVSPVAKLIGIPPETVPLALLRPLSGSGALAVFRALIEEHGTDSFIGRTAAVLMGSSETTFYTLSVYFGVTAVRDTRHTLFAALAGDFTGFLFSALAVRLLMGQD